MGLSYTASGKAQTSGVDGPGNGDYKGAMRRIAGMGLVLLGALPVLLLAAVGGWLWAEHMYTVGISVDPKALGKLASIVLADLACLAVGTWLWLGAGKSAA